MQRRPAGRRFYSRRCLVDEARLEFSLPYETPGRVLHGRETGSLKQPAKVFVRFIEAADHLIVASAVREIRACGDEPFAQPAPPRARLDEQQFDSRLTFGLRSKDRCADARRGALCVHPGSEPPRAYLDLGE